MSKNNVAEQLDEERKIKPVGGGRTIVQELEYAENSTYKRYSGYELLNIAASDTLTAAEWNYAQAVVAVTISGLEQLELGQRGHH